MRKAFLFIPLFVVALLGAAIQVLIMGRAPAKYVACRQRSKR
jgi:hypothetical protein